MDFCHVHFLRHELGHLVPDFFLELSDVFFPGGFNRFGSSDECLYVVSFGQTVSFIFPLLAVLRSSYPAVDIIIVLDVLPDSGSTHITV